MKQLTKEQAKKVAESEVWKDWTDEEIVRFQLFQERLCMDFSKFHEAVEKILGRPVFTHELGFNYEGIKQEYLGIKSKPTFDEILNLIPKEKRILIVKNQ